jgi:hypothetical protein
MSQEPQVVIVKHKSAWNSCLGYGCLAIAALFVFIAISVAVGGRT